MLKLPKIWHLDEVGKVEDPNYCKYHMMLGHPTKSYYFLTDILQTLADAGALKICAKQKMVSANVTSFIQFGQSPPISMTANPIPTVEL